MTERARDPEEKEERRRDIVDAALRRFDEEEYSDITMLDVARGAGIAKGTLYLYFDTKEELFLRAAIRLITSWFDDLDSELEALPNPVSDPERVGAAIASTLAEADNLKRILPLLHTTIERNIDVELAADYKESLETRLSAMAEQLESKIEAVDRSEGLRLLLWLYAFVVGLDQLANPPAPMQEAIDDREFELFSVDFETELADAAARWIRAVAGD